MEIDKIVESIFGPDVLNATDKKSKKNKNFSRYFCTFLLFVLHTFCTFVY